MSNADRGHLVGYLVGALEPDEQRALDQQVAHDPELRRELAELQSMLAPLRDARRWLKPPEGLAARTCEFVALFGSPAKPASSHLAGRLRPRARRMSPALAPPSSATQGSWAELAVALGVLVCIGLALVPAIHRARSYARQTQCQNTLRQIGVAYTNLMQQHPVRLPNTLRREARLPWAQSASAGATLPAAAPARNILLGDGRVLLICRDAQYLPFGPNPPPEVPPPTPLPAITPANAR